MANIYNTDKLEPWEENCRELATLWYLLLETKNYTVPHPRNLNLIMIKSKDFNNAVREVHKINPTHAKPMTINEVKEFLLDCYEIYPTQRGSYTSKVVVDGKRERYVLIDHKEAVRAYNDLYEYLPEEYLSSEYDDDYYDDDLETEVFDLSESSCDHYTIPYVRVMSKETAEICIFSKACRPPK